MATRCGSRRSPRAAPAISCAWVARHRAYAWSRRRKGPDQQRRDGTAPLELVAALERVVDGVTFIAHEAPTARLHAVWLRSRSPRRSGARGLEDAPGGATPRPGTFAAALVVVTLILPRPHDPPRRRDPGACGHRFTPDSRQRPRRAPARFTPSRRRRCCWPRHRRARRRTGDSRRMPNAACRYCPTVSRRYQSGSFPNPAMEPGGADRTGLVPDRAAAAGRPLADRIDLAVDVNPSAGRNGSERVMGADDHAARWSIMD